MKHSQFPILWTAAIGLCLTQFTGQWTFAQDADEDGITDALEAQLLSHFAPVWRANDGNQRPPLPLDWYVRHCQLRWYDQEYNGSSGSGSRLGDTGNNVLSLDYLVLRPYDSSFHYRLGFKLFNPYIIGGFESPSWFRNGHDPDDRITWQRLQNEQRGVYGRVASLDGRETPGCGVLPGSTASCHERYLVQYYLFFGYNVTDHPDESLGPCGNFGNHEGDVICVEFEVEWPAGESPRLLRSVFNNHGRKIFVDSPAALNYEAGRPIVYLERESQEPVPWPGDCGLWPGQPVPPCIGANETFPGREVLGYRMGGECEDWQVVRQHWGHHFGDAQPGLLVTSVLNLGEAGHPGPSLEARFLDRYPGLLGDEAFDEVCICYLFSKECFKVDNVTSPKGPRYQNKMWCREGHDVSRDAGWPGCKDIPVAQVDFGFAGVQSGTAASPFNSLLNALPVVAPGGTIIIAPGATSWRSTLCQPVTLTSSGGLVTIGQ